MREKNFWLSVAIVLSTWCVCCGEGPDDEDDGVDTSTNESDDDDSDSSSATDSDIDTESETTDDGPISDLSVLIGKTFILEIPEGNWTQPPGVGAEIGGYVPYFAFEITKVDGNNLDVLMGTAKDNAQDMCNKTASFTGAVDDNPHFQIGPADFDAIVEGEDTNVVATVHEMTITGSFTGQGSAYKKGTFSAIVDFRDIYMLFTLLDNPTPDSICQTAPSLGFQCEVCPFDNQTYCISILAENLEAMDIADLTLTEVAEMDESCLE